MLGTRSLQTTKAYQLGPGDASLLLPSQMEEPAPALDDAAEQAIELPRMDKLARHLPANLEALLHTKAAKASPKAPEVHMHASATDQQHPLHRPLSMDTAWARAHSSRDGHAAQVVDPSTLQEYLPNRAFTEPRREPLGVGALDFPIPQLRTDPSGEWHH